MCERGSAQPAGIGYLLILPGVQIPFCCVALPKFWTAFLLYSYGSSQTQVWIRIFLFFVQKIFLSIFRIIKKKAKLFISPTMDRNIIVTMVIYSHTITQRGAGENTWMHSHSKRWKKWSHSFLESKHGCTLTLWHISTIHSSAAVIWVIAFNWFCGLFYFLKLSKSKYLKLQTMQKCKLSYACRMLYNFRKQPNLRYA